MALIVFYVIKCPQVLLASLNATFELLLKTLIGSSYWIGLDCRCRVKILNYIDFILSLKYTTFYHQPSCNTLLLISYHHIWLSLISKNDHEFCCTTVAFCSRFPTFACRPASRVVVTVCACFSTKRARLFTFVVVVGARAAARQPETLPHFPP